MVDGKLKVRIIYGQQLGQIHRRKLLKEPGKLPVGKNRSFLFMEGMEEYVKEIHMVMIHILRKGNGYKKICSNLISVSMY